MEISSPVSARGRDLARSAGPLWTAVGGRSAPPLQRIRRTNRTPRNRSRDLPWPARAGRTRATATARWHRFSVPSGSPAPRRGRDRRHRRGYREIRAHPAVRGERRRPLHDATQPAAHALAATADPASKPEAGGAAPDERCAPATDPAGLPAAFPVVFLAVFLGRAAADRCVAMAAARVAADVAAAAVRPSGRHLPADRRDGSWHATQNWPLKGCA